MSCNDAWSWRHRSDHLGNTRNRKRRQCRPLASSFLRFASSNGLHPSSDGLQPNSFLLLVPKEPNTVVCTNQTHCTAKRKAGKVVGGILTSSKSLHTSSGVPLRIGADKH